MRKIKAIITCAGFATRLWPLTRDFPKPLLEVKGKPIVEHIIDKLLEIPEVDAAFIVTNSRFYDSFEKWLSQMSFRIPIKVIDDGTSKNEDRLGQIGDILLVLEKEKVDDDVVIIAGDNLFNFSLKDSHETFRKSKSVMNPLYDIGSVNDAKQLGVAVLDENNCFSEFFEKPENPKSTLVSLGIYFFPKEKLSLIKEYITSGENPDKMGYFLSWLMKRDKVIGHTYYEKWFDIGWIKSLEQARKEFRA